MDEEYWETKNSYKPAVNDFQKEISITNHALKRFAERQFIEKEQLNKKEKRELRDKINKLFYNVNPVLYKKSRKGGWKISLYNWTFVLNETKERIITCYKTKEKVLTSS